MLTKKEIVEIRNVLLGAKIDAQQRSNRESSKTLRNMLRNRARRYDRLAGKLWEMT